MARSNLRQFPPTCSQHFQGHFLDGRSQGSDYTASRVNIRKDHKKCQRALDVLASLLTTHDSWKEHEQRCGLPIVKANLKKRSAS